METANKVTLTRIPTPKHRHIYNQRPSKNRENKRTDQKQKTDLS